MMYLTKEYGPRYIPDQNRITGREPKKKYTGPSWATIEKKLIAEGRLPEPESAGQMRLFD